MRSTTIHRLLALSAGLLCVFAILEATLQTTHLLHLLQNRKTATPDSTQAQSRPFTIMCIGESMTAGINGQAYPDKLEQILKKRYPGKNIRVLNKAVYKSTAYVYARDMEFYINAYHPDVVIAMLGINDIKSFTTAQHIKTRIAPSWWNNLRSVYLIKSLILALREKNLQAPNTPPAQFQAQLEWYWNQYTFRHFLFNSPQTLDRKMLKYAKTPFAKTFWQAKNMLNEGFPDKAMDLLLKANRLNPTSPDVYAIAALTLNLNRTQNLYAKAWQLAGTPPQNTSDPYNTLTGIFRQKCEKLFKDPSGFYLCWGRWHLQYDEFEPAHKAFEQGLSQSAPDSAQANDFAALSVHMDQKQKAPQKAMTQIKQVLTNDPANLYALRLGALMEFNAPPNSTPRFLHACIKFYPQFQSAYIALAINHYQNGEYAKTRELLEQAAQIEPLTNVREVQMLEDTYLKLENREPTQNANRIFAKHYREIFKTIDRHGIKLIAMQYPMRSVESLKAVFTPAQRSKIIFADNNPIFKKMLKTQNYDKLFVDSFARNFGHFTKQGCFLAAKTAAQAVAKVLPSSFIQTGPEQN